MNIESKGYAFQMELITRSKIMGFSVKEVPITFVDRLYGQSKLGLSEIVQYIIGLCSLFFSDAIIYALIGMIFFQREDREVDRYD